MTRKKQGTIIGMKTQAHKKIAVVTGVSSGIGFAAAKLFIRNGYTVYGLSRTGVNDAEKINFIPCDLADDAQVAAALEKIAAAEGKIDVLVNNAGMGIAGPAEDVKLTDARYIFEVNFFGAVKTLKAAAAVMRAGGGGSVVNVSSAAGVFPIPFQSFYSATKAALSIWSEAVNLELRPFNIRVSAVLPGDVKTNFTAVRRKADGMPAHYAKQGG
jgi:short-subunit dehydrogenase